MNCVWKERYGLLIVLTTMAAALFIDSKMQTRKQTRVEEVKIGSVLERGSVRIFHEDKDGHYSIIVSAPSGATDITYEGKGFYSYKWKSNCFLVSGSKVARYECEKNGFFYPK